jgi:ribosomal protein S18 acetylase RimI-like enzyme
MQEIREAGPGDVAALVGLMRDFYAESGFGLAGARAAATFEHLLARPEFGRIWLIERAGRAAGYIVVAFVFAIEHGGLTAVVDDFYVRPEARGEGLGSAALSAVRRACEDLGLRAMRVEVGEHNVPAQAVYRGAGFELLPGHRVMQLALAPPSHAT